MRKSWLLCVLLGTLAWGQAAPGAPPPQPAQAPVDTAAAVPADAAVITVRGVCSAQPKATAAKGTAAKPATVAKTPAADCKTIITKAEFEKLAASLAPNITPPQRKQLATVLPRFMAMSEEAKKKGLDKTPQFEQKIKFARMQLLTNELQAQIQVEAAKVPAADIASYYKEHPDAFEQFNLDRLFVPRTRQDTEAKEQEDTEAKEGEKNEKPTEEQRKAKQDEEKAKAAEGEQAMSKLAESLRARAAAGEDIVKLQKEAFDAAGMKIESPTVNLAKVRRSGLPPAHAAVFELKPGDVSQVINDSGGHYIYKVNSKDMQTLDQVKEEIHNTLQNQRSREMLEKVNGSFKVETNEAYFGPGGPMPGGGGAMGMGGRPMPPPRLPNPRMAPGPIAPAAQPQAAPPAQPPAAKPN